MINVLVPIVDKPNDYLKSVMALNGLENVQLIIGVTESIAQQYDFNLKNAVLKTYKNGTQKEQIINDLQSNIAGDGTLIARKPFTKEDFDAMTTTNANIVTCAGKKRNRFTAFFYNLWANLVKFIFGVKLFDGDPSLIYFDGELSQVLPQVANLSYVSRVDRWKGATQEVVKTKYPPANLNSDRNFNLILLVCSLLSLAVGALVTTLVAVFIKVNVLAVIALFLFDVLCVAIFVLLMISYLFNCKVGRKDVKRS